MDITEICAALKGKTLPRWEELPDFDLYMDQTVALVNRSLGENGDSALTPSMVNNYVKLKVIPAPEKKRYGRRQLAGLIVICALKNVLSIGEIKALLEREAAEGFYDRFCELYAFMNRAAAEAAEKTAECTGEANLLCSALRARSEQEIARKLL